MTFFYLVSTKAQTDAFNKSINFNGNDLSIDGDYVEIDDDPTLNFDGSSSFSIQFRMYPRTFLTAAGTKQGLVTKKSQTGPGYGVFWEVTASTSRIVFELNDGANTVRVESSDIPNINVIRWTNVSAVIERDANGINDSIWLYIDGEVVDKKESGVIGSVSNTDKVYLMRSAADPSQTNAGGYLDDIRIWNTALTERQVRRIYNEPIYEGLTLGLVRTVVTDRFTTLLWSSLMMYLDIEDPLGTFEVFDKSLNSNDGGFYEGPSGVLCSTSGCGPAFIIPPVGEKPPNFTCNTIGDWSNPSTWVGGTVPTPGDNTSVFVLDGAELTIDPLAIYIVKEVNVAEGGKLISDKLSELQITKHFDVDGTYETDDGGLILFDEVGDHTIDGSGTGTLDFFFLALFQNSQLQINVPVNVYGVFFHENGRVRTNDQMTIRSNSSNTDRPYGLISRSSVGDPDVVGLIKMELELSNTSAGWRQMAFPLSGDFSDFQGLTLNLSTAPQAERNVFYWDSNADATIPANNAGWTSPSAISNQIRAYSIYLDNNNFSFTNPITFEGEYNPGDKIYPLTYLNDPGNGILLGQPGYENGVGWNFIPNLYPSLLNTADMTADNPLQYKNIHVWDANVQQYKAFTDDPSNSAVIIPYNNQGTDLAELSSAGIMPFQGFWVKTTDNSETFFTLQNDWRGISFSNLNPQQSLKAKHSFQIDVFSDLDSAWDGALVAFEDNASQEFKNEEDVYKLMSPGNVPSVYIETSNVFASVHSTENVEQKIKLHFKPNPLDKQGWHHFHLSQDHSQSHSSIVLEDLITGELINLKKEDYSFKNSSGNSSRFNIHYFPNGKNVQELLSPQIIAFATQDGIEVRFKNIQSLRASILIINTIGQVVFEAANISTQENYVIPVSNENKQAFIVRVVTSELTQSVKVIR
jgi:hypothetical protein